MKDRCIISFANNSGNYYKALDRLKKSVIHDTFIGFIDESSISAPPHKENPYAFKVYAFWKAINMGYTKILWLDSSCYVIGSLDEVWQRINKDGFIMQDAGHNIGTWSNDKTLDYFGVSRDDAMTMPMYGNAGFLGLDISHPIAAEFLTRWNNAMKEGYFKGAWDNNRHTESSDSRCKGHRHDMTCGSIIANQIGMHHKYVAGDEILQYAAPTDKVNNLTIVIKAQGL
jgi:hypothetical protein